MYDYTKLPTSDRADGTNADADANGTFLMRDQLRDDKGEQNEQNDQLTQLENEGDDDVFTESVEGTSSDIYDSKKYSRNDVTLEISYTKQYERSGSHLTSNVQTLMHILKGNIGTGVLALPIAMKYAGWALGLVILLVSGAICTHCMHLAVSSAHHLYARYRVEILDFGQVGYLATKDGPASLRSTAKATRVFINTINNVMQLGFCSVYLLFIAQNIDLFVKQFLDSATSWIPPIYFYEALVFFLLIPYQYVTNLDLLSYFSAAANLITVCGLGLVVVYCVSGPFEPVNELPLVGDISTVALAISICVFAFESINLILPIENKMRSPSGFRGLCGMLQIGLNITLLVYILIALLGYFRFGEAIQPSISLSIPNSGVYASIQPLFAISIFISYGLQMYVPAVNIWNELKQWRRIYNNAFLNSYGDVVLRIVLLTLTFGLAVLIPYLDLMISLMGALFLVPLGIIVPPIIQIYTMWPEFVSRSINERRDEESTKMLEADVIPDSDYSKRYSLAEVFSLGHRDDLTTYQKYYWRFLLLKDIALVLIGVFALAVGTYCSVRDIVIEFGKPQL